jgi:hypothetical protein
MPRPTWDTKNWKSIVDSLSSGEDSDAGDELNVMQVQKNARRVAELMHQVVPGLTDKEHLQGNAPMGMNNAHLIREGLVASMNAQSRYAAAHHSRSAETHDGTPIHPVPDVAPSVPPPIPESSRHPEPEQGIVV